MTCPKERTLWPEEEPNPNEPEQLVIVLPVPMPTWNRILQMHHWERMKLRKLLHAFVSMSIDGSSRHRDLMAAEYFAIIRPSDKNRQLSKAAKKNAR